MNWWEYNERVREAARHQPLPGFIRDGDATIKHKWPVAVELVSPADASTDFDFGTNPLTGQPYFSASVFNKPVGTDPAQPVYRVFVGDGTVNDQPACIEYLAKDDPRGWVMPDNYAPAIPLRKVFGKDYPYVDRPLWDNPAPIVLLTAPDLAEKKLGGFEAVDTITRPQFFRTEEMWEKNLYRAYVTVSLSPYRSDPTQVLVVTGGARATRWRVSAGLKPTAVSDAGIAKIASWELARIYLARTPGKVELDEVYIEQRSYWPLRARSSVNTALLELIGVTAEVAAGLDLGLLALSMTGLGSGLAVGTALLGIEAGLVGILVANLEDIVAATSGVLFWDS